MEERQRDEGDGEGASPEWTLPSLAGDQGEEAPSGLLGASFPPWGLLPKAPLCQPHPQVLQKKKGLSEVSSFLNKVGTHPGPTAFPPGPSSSLLTPCYHPLPCPGQGGAQVKLKLGRGPGTFCSFLHHWLPGQECVMSPVVVTGLQECGHREAAQGPGRAPGHRPGAQGTLGTADTQGTGRDVGSTGRHGGSPVCSSPGRKEKLTGWGCVFPPKSQLQT